MRVHGLFMQSSLILQLEQPNPALLIHLGGRSLAILSLYFLVTRTENMYIPYIKMHAKRAGYYTNGFEVREFIERSIWSVDGIATVAIAYCETQ